MLLIGNLQGRKFILLSVPINCTFKRGSLSRVGVDRWVEGTKLRGGIRSLEINRLRARDRTRESEWSCFLECACLKIDSTKDFYDRNSFPYT